MTSLRSSFLNPAIPREYRANFLHLYFDIAWFGVLSGSAVNFLNVYAARLGASGFQIGLLGATSAVVNLIFAIPAGRWLEKRPIGKAVFWTSIAYRFGYLLWIPLPWIFNNQGQIWALISLALAMGIPLAAFTVGFNALFASSVPTEWRAHVAGIRNVVLSVTFILSSLGSGALLDRVPFPSGYQIVFGIGAVGGLISSLHLFSIRIRTSPFPAGEVNRPQPDPPAERPAPPRDWRLALRADVWRSPFSRILLVMLGLHLAQYLSIPIFPLYLVNALHLSDEHIGLGTALFYLAVLIGSMQLSRVVRRFDHHRVTGYGFIGMSLYPILLSFSHTAGAYYFTSAVGGLMWAMVGGAYANYLLENIPADDRPAYLAWYNIILNAAILLGSLAGPLIARFIGLGLALFLFGICRLLAGTAILKWGQPAQDERIESRELGSI